MIVESTGVVEKSTRTVRLWRSRVITSRLGRRAYHTMHATQNKVICCRPGRRAFLSTGKPEDIVEVKLGDLVKYVRCGR